jgi:ubiquinone/menaquinone biosynthesis C-methylase UbiE
MGGTPNICAGPFGTVYDVYIERPWLMRAIGRVVWGMDASILYSSMAPIGEARDVTILDVPCGGGVAFRALRSEQRVRYIAGDLCPKMLRRAERRARKRSLNQVEFVAADMTELPIADSEVDLFLSFSGLHMVDEPERAVAEIARCLKPGGQLIGTAFFSDVSRRARTLFAIGARSGHPLPPSRDDLLRWLTDAGLSDPVIGPQRGFATFSARKAQP